MNDRPAGAPGPGLSRSILGGLVPGPTYRCGECRGGGWSPALEFQMLTPPPPCTRPSRTRSLSLCGAFHQEMGEGSATRSARAGMALRIIRIK